MSNHDAEIPGVRPPCGCDRPDMVTDHPRMAGCSLYSDKPERAYSPASTEGGERE